MWNSTGNRSFIASLLMQTSIVALAAAGPSASCRTLSTQALRVHLVDEAGLVKDTLDVARKETSAIWAAAGLSLTWTGAPDLPGPPDGRSIIVVIRRDLSPDPSVTAVSATSKPRRPLGWLVFDDKNQSGHLIEVSYAATESLIRRAAHLDIPMRAMPTFAQHIMLGRGLGRVMAHEIGHWLMGRGHVGVGLMKPRFGALDLVDFRPPEIPKDWLSAQTGDDAEPMVCAVRALQRLTALDRAVTTQRNSEMPSAPRMALSAVQPSIPN